MVSTTDTSRLIDSTARTGRILSDVSDLDQDIVLLQFGESNLLNRGSLTLRVLREMSSSEWYGMTPNSDCGAGRGQETYGLVLDEGTHLSGNFERHLVLGLFSFGCG